MNNDRSRRPSDPRKNAEALFKPAAPKPLATPSTRVTLPPAREQVSLRVDSDVLEHFQSTGPGWQDRINDALRQAAGLTVDAALRPDQLNSSNDG